MRRFVITSTGLTKAILLLSLCALLIAAVPVTVVHSHADATVGHMHDFAETQHSNDHEHPDQDKENGHESESLHAHTVNVLLLAAAPTLQPSASGQPFNSVILLPVDNWLPDKPVSPLFRPPIA